MDQFAQTNDLQQAIDNVANGGNATAGTDNAPFGVPPMPPADNNPTTAPIDMMFTTAPVPEGGPEMPKVEPLVPPEAPASEAPTTEPAGPSAEQILSESLNMSTPTTEAPATPEAVETVSASDLADVKQNILKELLPLLDKTEKTPEEKFAIYKDAIETMHDVKTIEGAYKAASGIADEAKKADALFELMKVIDAQ